MGRSHRPRGPSRRTSLWQPVPLRLPLDRPGRDPGLPAGNNRQPTEDDLDRGLGRPGSADDDDVGGNHVIVIDLA
jgi:hypothetical protein